MQGANYIFLESGNTGIESFGYKYDYDHEYCKAYRDYTEQFYKFAKENVRPKNGPLTNVAFIFGEDDGYADFLGSHAWCQFGKKEWQQGEREKSWKILDEVFKSSSWYEFENVSGCSVDLSNAPAYGNYDVIPASSSLEILKNYDYIIFVGHNTMSKKIYSNLVDYVKNGGTLLACAAHMRSDSTRNEFGDYVNDGDFSDLFGLKINGNVNKNHGIKFYTNSNVKGLVYPATKDLECDANYPAGYANVATIKLCGAEVFAKMSDTFAPLTENDLPILTEYKNGKGVAMFLTYTNFPGNPAVYPVYKIVVKQLLTASHRNSEIKVYGSDKVKFSVYDDDLGNKKLYLLNTDFDVSSSVGIIYQNKNSIITLSPLELKEILI